MLSTLYNQVSTRRRSIPSLPSTMPQRCDSPPPRSTTPDAVFASLSPPPRPPAMRLTCLSLDGRDTRPTIDSTASKLKSMPSCGELRQPPTPKGARSFRSSAPPTPKSESSPSFFRPHKRTLSLAARTRPRSRSPPPSPTMSSPPPPVPPIPAFVLAPTDKKAIIHAVPSRLNQGYLPEWEHYTAASRPKSTRTSNGVAIMSARRAVAAPAPLTACSSVFFAMNDVNASNQTPIAAL
ncbi:hypothetical protein MKEN_00083500 [Mycena kentingensis (nom. inval.)]|nr:hypothetical protein MKEN_00083500 [Mycena kentingensis (nom. inval.)]